MYRSSLNFLVFAACCCVAVNLGSRVLSADDALVRKIDKLVQDLGITSDSPGVAILIHQPGHVNFSKGYGLANLNRKTPITSSTLFELASASKPITATAVLILSEQGKLSLDDDVRKHLPELPDYASRRKITVRDLLQHISGLPDYMAFQNVPAKNSTFRINEDYLSQFEPQKDTFPLRFQPGEKYEYSNANYMLLATLVQRVSKKPFSEFMRDNVFAPAGMKATFVCDSPSARPKDGDITAIGYIKEGERWNAMWGAPPDRNEEMLTVGDGAIWSTVEDVARWDAAVRAGKYFKKPLARAAMTPSNTRDGATNNYGLGWTLYFDGAKLIGMGHDGYWGGFSTTYYSNLMNRRTTVILSNCNSYGGDEFWYKLDAVVDQHLSQRRKR